MTLGKDEITIRAKEYEKAVSFVEDLMKKHHIIRYTANETMLVFDALYRNIMSQGLDPDKELRISGAEKFGELMVQIGFEGHRFSALAEETEEVSPENKILTGFSDKLDNVYHTGYNTFRITVKRNYSGIALSNMAALLAAIIVYVLIRLITGTTGDIEYLAVKYVYPLETAFANTILMLAAPVTFLTLLKNLTNVYIVSERNSKVQRLYIDAVLTSALMIVLALAFGYLALSNTGALKGILADYIGNSRGTFLLEGVNSIFPSNLFAVFIETSPFPIIIVAILLTYALCSAGAYFEIMKTAIDTLYSIFSRMLTVVMYFLPAAFFLAIMDTMLSGGFTDLLFLIGAIAVLVVSLVVPAICYFIILLVNGVRPAAFFRKLMPLIRENLKINSVIDAAPYNTRYCSRVFGYDYKKLQDYIPVLAQVNLDGNCYILTVFTMLFFITGDISVSWKGMIVLCILILFMSFGAPNQPGSCLIGGLIILNYFNSYTQLTNIVIAVEVFMGSILNIFNLTGDIVTLAIDNERQNRKT